MRRAALLAVAFNACTCTCTCVKAPPPQRPAPKPWTGPTGAVEGVAAFSGVPPEPARLHRESDPVCAREPMLDPEVLVRDGKLQNVWVHVAGAPDAPPPAEAVSLDQRDCMYVPRVTTAVVGQTIAARNDDPTLHNIHAYSGATTLFNRGMVNERAPAYQYTPELPTLMKWKCDVHPWMRGYVGVSNNALQAVTGADGAFHIAGVPPGSYTLTAWHEKYGEQSEPLVVQAGQTARASFTFAAK